MKNRKWMIMLTAGILLLALLSVLVGLFDQQVHAYADIQTSFGETIHLHQKGLYARDSVSMAAQAAAQDIVTLVLGIPLLVAALVLVLRNSGKGLFLLTGTAGYFLYTYASYAFLMTYNCFYLIYVALMILSFYLFLLGMMQLSQLTIGEWLTERFPRRGLAVFLTVTGSMLLLMWLGRIVPAILSNTAPVGLEHYSTLGIQTLDLGFVVPACFLAAVLLKQKKQWGYLLAIVLVIKALTMAAAVSAMTVAIQLAGEPITLLERFLFPVLFVFCIFFVIRLFQNISEPQKKKYSA